MKLGLGSKSHEESEGIAPRLAAMTAARIAFLILLLVVISVFYLGGSVTRYPVSSRIVFVTIAAAFASAAVFATLLRTGRRLRLLAEVQLFIDQLTWTAIVYVSGGATSGATSFYALTALVGAIVTGQRGAALAATSGIGVYTILCGAFWLHIVTPPADQAASLYTTEGAQLIYPLLVNTLGIVVVALLAGYLAERLRLAGGALAAATQRVADAERLAALGRLSAGLAHEIRNPLGSILGSIEILRDSPMLSAEDKTLCDIVRRESIRLNSLVTDMIDLSKPRPPQVGRNDVAALANDVVSLARVESRGAGDVVVSYVGPEAAEALCDGGQMRQVLWNLVRNAVQASPAGAEVIVRVETDDESVTLGVEDHGPGISAADREKLFDAFYTTRSHGTGIGLAVVKRIVDEHAAVGAELDVTSPEGGGASFRVRLRRA